MGSDEEPKNLEAVLQRLEQAGEDEQPVSIGHMLQAGGQRSFGVLLLMPGLLVLSPLSGIPGLPSVCAVMVALIALQLLIGRKHFWLPRWLLARKASRDKYDRALTFLHRLARYIDRLLRPRLCFLTRGPAVPVNALFCLLIAASMPPMELIPFANTLSGAALSALGLGLIARDGLMTLLALVLFLVLAMLFGRLLF